MKKQNTIREMSALKESSDIAIVGMACRFPSANNYNEFWINLFKGANSISEISSDRWDIQKYYSSDRNEPNKSISKWAGQIEGIDCFDAPFFNISPREAESMDPQQRILMEEVWHCVEDSGASLKELQGGNTCVYIGVMATDYQQRISQVPTDAYACLGNYEGILANRISYFFNLRGESQSVDTACASSLVALHLARRNLSLGESKYAIVAGVNVICHPWKYISFSKANMLSPDGKCKTFDASANGYVPGEGVGVLLLMSAREAIQNGYSIYGLLKGSSVHHNGRTKSITAPRVKAQKEVIEEAMHNANISPGSITYLEAHGTGTSLGDPIEIEALRQAFAGEKTQHCYIGSVKTNIGHLEGAAGIAGVIKVLLMMKHHKIVKTLNVETTNPIIDFEHSPFRLAKECIHWELPKKIAIRRAGVSSFGFGGIDAHVIIEEYKNKMSAKNEMPEMIPHPFILSAKTLPSLKMLLNMWKEYIQTEAFNTQPLNAILLTLMRSRESFACRFGGVVSDKRSFIQSIQEGYIEENELKSQPERKIILKLNSTGIRIEDFHTLCRTYHILSQVEKETQKTLSDLNLKEEGMKRYLDFIWLMMLGGSLLRSGLKPDYIMGEGIGSLAAMVLSGMIKIKDAFLWLEDASYPLQMKRPQITFYDHKYNRWIEPLKITAEYCRMIKEDFTIESDEFEEILKQAKELSRYQFTFKKFLADWEEIVKKYDFSMKKVDDILMEQLTSSQQNLLAIVLFVSMRKLNLKWELSDKIKIKNPVFTELVDLIVDQAISYEKAADWLCVKSDDAYTEIAKHIEQNKIKLNKPYTLLKKINTAIIEIHSPNEWINEIIQCEERHLNASLKATPVIVESHFLEGKHTPYGLTELLVALWKEGINIDWELWYNETFQKVALPTYPFTKIHYWMHEKKEAVLDNQPQNENKNDNKEPAEQKINIQKESDALLAKVKKQLVSFTASILRLNEDNILPDENLSEYGMDSLGLYELAISTDECYGTELNPAVLFEYTSLSAFAQYLVNTYAEKLNTYYAKMPLDKTEPIPTESKENVIAFPNVGQLSEEKKEEVLEEKPEEPPLVAPKIEQEGIAVIGMHGIFPKASDLKMFWKNLVEGKDCIREIPKERCGEFKLTEEEKENAAIKWGGFIDDVDKFDASFFNISPREAELMDPQQRILLQSVYNAMEDAGYTSVDLSKGSTGIFVGLASENYDEILRNAGENSAYFSTGTLHSILSNRISYLFNFHGPSETVDTACSSSLVAIHHAVRSIEEKECDLAFACAINVLLTPTLSQSFSQAGMLSKDGRCKTFDQSANGYVRGEGVGVILLKPLAKALLDKDTIYGVIKGTAMNHGGRVTSLTVPNPNAQAEVIEKAFDKAKINIANVNYIETHGTGTPLGDPIEINGLKKAFHNLAAKQNISQLKTAYCALGTVKTQIGHLEGAAGIASVIKVLLSMQHKTLPGILHFKALNPRIEINDTPFYIHPKSASWEHLKNDAGQALPYVAGISSFGFGGANAHVVIEEAPTVLMEDSVKKTCYLFTFSAKTPHTLKEKIAELYHWLENDPNPALEDISYTLNVGRVHYDYRYALVASTIEELRQSLKNIMEDKLAPNTLVRNEKTEEIFNPSIMDEILKNTMEVLSSFETMKEADYRDKLIQLATLFVMGRQLDWDKLHIKEKKHRIPLPTYPFEKTRYWVETQNVKLLSHLPKIHPLLDSNESTFNTQIFKKTFYPTAYYFKDHVINKEMLFPGTGYLEMIRAAGAFSGEQPVKTIKDLIWIRPITVDKLSKAVYIELMPEDSYVNFKIYSKEEDKKNTHCQGVLSFESKIQSENNIDFDYIEKHFTLVDKEKINEKFKKMGYHYGPSFQVIQKIWVDDKKEAWIELALPKHMQKTAKKYELHPSLIDGAVRMAALMEEEEKLFIPFAIDLLEIYKPVNGSCYAYITHSSDPSEVLKKFNIVILNEKKEISLKMNGFVMRDLRQEDILAKAKEMPAAVESPTSQSTGSELQKAVCVRLVNIVSDILKMKTELLDENKNFSQYGMDSITFTIFADEVNEYYGLSLTPAILFEHGTIRSFADYLMKEHLQSITTQESIVDVLAQKENVTVSLVPNAPSPLKKKIIQDVNIEKHTQNEIKHPDIAIIGISGLFPGANDLDMFWQNLVEEADLITETPTWRWEHVADSDSDQMKWGGFVGSVDQFEPLFFNISPKEAELMDPQHRLFIETAWKVIEDAGYTPKALSSIKTGVFVGVGTHDYASLIERSGQMDAYVATGVAHSILANRISYLFDFHGPSEVVDTACSSSLVALHQAIQAIQHGDCEVAIAGGVNALLTPFLYLAFNRAGMLSPDGRCKTFDKSANGYVRGEGVGAILLKPLDKALEDRDHIYGVIKGTAVNHGGHVSSLTVPNPNAQAELIAAAWKQAEINVKTIHYIETHGTGTSLGDPIEVNGLKKAFKMLQESQGESELPSAYCGLGTVKTNIGHLETAAGIAGIIKVLLAMKNEKLPGTVHFTELNPYIDIQNSPFYIVQKTQTWERLVDDKGEKVPYRAGVSSFGFGGTNAHVVLEEAPIYPPSESVRPAYLFIISGRTKFSLDNNLAALHQWLMRNNAQLKDMSYTLVVGRTHFSEHCIVIASSQEELLDSIDKIQKGQKIANGYISTVKEMGIDASALLTKIYKQTMDEIKLNGNLNGYKENLLTIANLYSQGYEIDWNQLYQSELYYKVSLPSYVFENGRYWVNHSVSNNVVHVEKKNQTAPPPVKHSPEEQREPNETLIDKAIRFVKQCIAESTGINPNQLEESKQFEQFGIDSLMIAKLNAHLEKYFAKLPVTLFFTYKNINELAQFLVNKHATFFVEGDESDNLNLQVPPVLHRADFQDASVVTEEDIAIVGFSGQFPMAENIEEYWENLKQGRNCVTEIPLSRWDNRPYYEKIHNKQDATSGKIYCQWGGFIKEVDTFDAELFNISPKIAKWMDPQERLFLQCVWRCLESAGNRAEMLSQVGVFVGVSYNNYQLLAEKANQSTDLASIVSSQNFSIANRVSYYFNWKGPSIPIDVACASSLSAIHLACESLRRGECTAAIAGGVNLSLHPSKYATLCDLGFLATDGVCHTFVEGGDGYVPGEGVGAILLKPMRLAKLNGDTIYACIKGSAMNHDGKTYQYGVPDPVAQSEVIEKALQVSKINGRSVSYLEAHGTGTELGDPIEISALSEAYQKYSKDLQYCPIGAVKSGIGHLESASGMSQLIKVLLQMKNKTLVPTVLHSKHLNPNIDFEHSPFYVQDKISPWQSFKDENNHAIPRRAGINSFGAGGVNVHMILEEYNDEENTLPDIENQQVVIPLSAQTENQLREMALNLKNFLHKYQEAHPLTAKKINMQDLAYTLQTGREVFSCRLAFVGKTLSEIIEKLTDYVNKENKLPIYQGKASTSKGSDLQLALNDLERWAQAWVSGERVDWKVLYQTIKPRLIYLPGYVFAKNRYWIENLDNQPIGEIKKPTLSPQKKNSLFSQNKRFLAELSDLTESEQIQKITEYLQTVIKNILGHANSYDIDTTKGFFELGMSSIDAIKGHAMLQKDLGITLSDTAFFDYPTIQAIVPYLYSLISLEALPEYDLKGLNEEATQQDQDKHEMEPIAIIGMACRFPGGANTPELFWELIKHGREGIVPIPQDRFDIAQYYDQDENAPGKMYTRHAGFLQDDVAAFDPYFFGISPKEAIDLDPQQRLMLELSWESLERAGINPESLKNSRTGVIVGQIGSEYAMLPRKSETIGPYTLTGVLPNLTTGRIAHFYGLQGPAITIDTACSSSLVSIHLACQSLQKNECDLMLAGGVNLLLSPISFIELCKVKALSRSGQCKTFDMAADGYGRGEGAGIIVLKRLSDAVNHGDLILGIIQATAVNQDGPSSGMTVPNGAAQQALIKEALLRAKLKPEDIVYFETHGTGTPLGDPIEYQAISEVFKQTQREAPLYLGSIKANIGHLEASAGIAALIKSVLCLQHQKIPPHVYTKHVNPRIKLDNLPAILPDKLIDWPDSKEKAIGINAFGFSGTNAHAIVKGYDAQKSMKRDKAELQILCLSAKSQTALEALMTDYVKVLLESPERLSDICYTANVGRASLQYRAALIGNSKDQLLSEISQFQRKPKSKSNHSPKIIFYFHGQDLSQEACATLSERFPIFRQAWEACYTLVQNANSIPELSAFASEYALAKLWIDLGIQPHGAIGNGIGIYALSCMTGAMRIEQAILCMQQVSQGMALNEVFQQNLHSAPQIGILDEETGLFLKKSELMQPSYWINQLSKQKESECLVEYLNQKELAVLDIAKHQTLEQIMRQLSRYYCNHLYIRWENFYSREEHHKCILPTYPFQRKKYWKTIEAGVSTKKIAYTMNAETFPEVRDNHNILHVGNFYDLIKKAIQQYFVIEKIVFIFPLYIPENEIKTITLVINEKQKDKIMVEVYSQSEGKPKTLHVKCDLIINRPTDFSHVVLPSIVHFQEKSTHYNDAFYAYVKAKKGLVLGESVQWINEIWSVDKEALAHLKPLPKGMPFHCGIWDACAQVFLEILRDSNVKYMVSAWEGFAVNFEEIKETNDLWVYAKVLNSDNHRMEGNFTLFNQQGKIIAHCEHQVVKAVDDTILNALHKTDSYSQTSPKKMEQKYATLSTEEKQSRLIRYLRETISGVMKMPVDELSEEIPLFNFGMDSLIAIEVQSQANTEIDIPIELLIKGLSIRELANELIGLLNLKEEAALNEKSRLKLPSLDKNLWIQTDTVSSTALKLFCFPYGGGGASLYQKWQEKMPTDIQIVPVQLPGRENRSDERPFDNIQTLVDALLAVLSSEFNSPFAFYGHSMGGLIAYSLASRLNDRREYAENLKQLFIGAYASPVSGFNPRYQQFVKRFAESPFKKIPTLSEIEESTDSDLNHYVALLNNELELQLNFKLKENTTMIKQVVTKLIADLRLAETPIENKVLSIPITVFAGESDEVVAIQEMWNWESLTTAKFNLYHLNGNHFFMHADQSQAQLLEILIKELKALH